MQLYSKPTKRQKTSLTFRPMAWASLIAAIAACIALYRVAPGFRPKHLQDMAAALLGTRGLGVFAITTTFAVLVPPAWLLKRWRYVDSTVAGIFVCFGGLISLDLILTLGHVAPVAATWFLRICIVFGCAFGISKIQKMPRSFNQSIFPDKTPISKIQKFLLGLILFFLLREQLHMIGNRGLPLLPIEDEIPWWFAMAKKILLDGLPHMIATTPYTPGLGWITSLGPRLWGSANTDLFVAYPFVITTIFLWYCFSISKNKNDFFIVTSLLFFTFSLSRDFHHLYAGMLYGEALASLLVAIILSEASSLIESASIRKALGLGLILGFASLSKPPISALITPISMLIALAVIYVRKGTEPTPLASRLRIAALLVAVAILPRQIWIWAGGIYEHTLSMNAVMARPPRFDIPLNMLKNIFATGSPQAAYAWGLTLLIVILSVQRRITSLVVVGFTLTIYWGAIFFLYATMWQDVEQGSAGRYLAHAAMGLILFTPKLLHFSNHKLLRQKTNNY